MKVLLINGSPRKDGNTFVALSEIANTLEKEHIALLKDYEDKEIYLGVRPEAVYLKGDKDNEKPSTELKEVCDFAELLGYELIIYTYLNGQKFIIKTSIKNKVESGDEVAFNLNMNNIYFFDAETEMRIK